MLQISLVFFLAAKNQGARGKTAGRPVHAQIFDGCASDECVRAAMPEP
jgi:hypothetical protein